jgi:hypothetical protein
MIQMLRIFVAVISLCTLLVVGSYAQKGARMYDTKTVETISGEVVSVDQFVNGRGSGQGMHLVVKTERETLSVRLGPTQYLESQDFRVVVGDRVEIKGSRVTLNGKPAIIAAEVKKDGKTLKLRDENGLPLWRGFRQGR